MGFAATGDAFCLPGDTALQGMRNCVKDINDILQYDEDYFTHLLRIHDLFSRCPESLVSFCDYTPSGKGTAADPKIRASHQGLGNSCQRD